MANLDAPYTGQHRAPARQKWSGRRTIGFALLSSGALWAVIFVIAKALVA